MVGVASDRLRIRTERVLVRKPQRGDDLSEFVGDVEVQRWTGGAGETPGAVTELGWAILQRDIDPANGRSIRVAEKLGATRTERVETPHASADVWVHPR